MHDSLNHDWNCPNVALPFDNTGQIKRHSGEALTEEVHLDPR